MLLYNTFGLAIAVLCFDKHFETASTSIIPSKQAVMAIPAPSLPYTTSWENEDGTAGLIKKDGEFYNIVHQKIENDTLFITLQTNASAREKFFELAGSMNDLSDNDNSKNEPSDRALKLLKKLVKSYLPIETNPEPVQISFLSPDLIAFEEFLSFHAAPARTSDSPPPEQA